jgi:protein kinase-like protein
VSPASQGEQAALDVAQSKGWIAPDELASLRQAAGGGPLLPLLAARLDESQRQELTRVYHQAAGSGSAHQSPTRAARGSHGAPELAPPSEAAFGATPAGFGTTPGAPESGHGFDSQATVPLPAPAAPTLGPVAARPSAEGVEREEMGDYVLLGELGRGGMGVVYRARHKTLEREVALKVLLSGGLAGPEEVRRFQQEGKAAARLEHPNVVRVLDQGRSEAGWFIALELIQGRSIQEELDDEGPMDPRAGAELLAKLARALHFAHERDVLHRDLKPHNVLIDEAGEPRLTDFGLAKLTGSADQGLTRSGAGAMGTPAFMSPEQASEAKHVDARSDVYGLGATLFSVLTGEPPFVGATYANLITSVLTQAPTDPRELVRAIPADLAAITLRCLEKDPDDRYASAADLADDLEAFLAERAVSARPASALTKKLRWAQRNPEPVLLAMAGFLLVFGLIGFFALRAESSATAAEQSELARLAHERELTEKAEALKVEEQRLAEARAAEERRREQAQKLRAKREAEEKARAEALAAKEAELRRLAEAATPSPAPSPTLTPPAPADLDSSDPGGQDGPGGQDPAGPGGQQEGPGGQPGPDPRSGGRGPGGQGPEGGPRGPGRHGPGRHGPGREGPGREGPGREGPGREGPGREGPGREGPGREGPGREGPGREGPGREGPGREGPGREGPGREGPGREGPTPAVKQEPRAMAWQARRLAAYNLAHGEKLSSPFLAANWEQAFREARARRVPVVVFWVDSDSKGPLRDPYNDPKYSRWLFQSAVVLIGTGEKHKEGVADGRIPVTGRACTRFHYTTCSEHKRIKEILKDRFGKRESSLQVLILSPQEELLLKSRRLKGGARLSRNEFERGGLDGDVLDRAQERIGPPISVYDVRPLESGFKAESKALFSRRRMAKRRGFESLVDLIETLPNKAPDEGRAWVETWLRWRCSERLGAMLDQIKLVPRPNLRRAALKSVWRIVKDHPQLLEQVQAVRDELGE